MDAAQFDRFVTAFAAAANRRALLRRLTALPLAGSLAARLADKGVAARRRDDVQEQKSKKKKNKKKCAKAGQKPKKSKKCCKGLGKDGSGLCAQPVTECSPANCTGTNLCLDGACQPCDVCPSGCFFSSAQVAVAAANPGDTIRICPGVYSGDLTIAKNLTVIGAGDGSGAGSTILQGSGPNPVVTILEGALVALAHLRVTGAARAMNTAGGGISNEGILTVTSCTVIGNSAGVGAGIGNFNPGTVTLTGCTIRDNIAEFGGGIANQAAMTLTSCTVIGNRAEEVGGGIDCRGIGSTLTLDAASRIIGNVAGDTGGGIHNYPAIPSTVTLPNVENVTGNNPNNCGGAAIANCVA